MNIGAYALTALQPLLRMMLSAKGALVGSDVRLNGRARVSLAARGTLRLGDRVTLSSLWTHNSLEARGPTILKTLAPGASITIGSDSGLTSVTISSNVRVTIGERVLVGAGVLITDSDHHPVDIVPWSARRRAGMAEPSDSHSVVIEDDVFVGARSIVLKGVTIGRGSVIGAGSVVVSSVPSGVVAAGNPCRVIRTLTQEGS